MGETVQIPITKAKSYIAVNTDGIEEGGDLTQEVYREALILGLKAILNRGTTKITKETYPKEEEMRAAAMAQAEKMFAQMKTNDIRFVGAKKVKEVSGEVMTEAMATARKHVKQYLKDQGIKVSHVKASEITKHAKALLVTYPQIVEDAKATVKARKEAAKGGLDMAGVFGQIEVDPKLVAKSEQEKAERKAAGSAAKAGKVAFRAKPTVQPQVTAH